MSRDGRGCKDHEPPRGAGGRDDPTTCLPAIGRL